MNTSEIYRKAADVIRERGWCQGQYEDRKGRVCIATAIHYASGGRPIGATAHRPPQMDRATVINATDTFVQLVVADEHSFFAPRIESFNNYHCKTKNDAIAALEIAADLAA